jgi:hypothetical protein
VMRVTFVGGRPGTGVAAAPPGIDTSAVATGAEAAAPAPKDAMSASTTVPDRPARHRQRDELMNHSSGCRVCWP